ncbi:hypothetical protein QP64_00035, partial [Staphylococcus aureus]
GIGAGHAALAGDHPARHRSQRFQRAHARAAEEIAARRLESGDIVEMVLEIAAHRRPVDPHRQAHLAQMLARTDAGEHQQLRRLEGAGGEHHRAARPDLARHAIALIGDAPDPAVLEQHALHARLGDDLEALAALQI